MATMAVTANRRRPRGVHAFALTALIASIVAPAAQALDWRLEPSVSASATYTDNANQSENNPEDALILSVMPGFMLSSHGSRRVQASLQYGLRGVARFGEDNNTDLNHNLNAVGNAELIEDFLFIDGSARISQELISLFGSPAEAEINDRNRTTAGTYSISPYIQKRLGTFANAQARYTTSGAIFENNAAADSSINAFTAGLSSGTRFNDLSWALNYSLRKAENRNAADAAANVDTTLESASATVGYALTRKFRVFGTAGQDWNEYLSTTGTDGSFYSLGFGWSPTRRTSVEASVGERYFGNTYSFSGSHRTRMSRWSVSYIEDVSDITQQLLVASSKLFWACVLSPLEVFIVPATDAEQPPNCAGPFTAGQILNSFPSLTDAQVSQLGLTDTALAKGIFIIKSLNAGVSWDIGRLTFGLSAYDTRRLYQALSDAEDRVRGMIGSVSYRLARQTTANTSLSFTRTSADATLSESGLAREDDRYTLSLGLNHQFTNDLSGSLVFRHTERDSNAADADYAENRLTATANMSF